MIGSACSGYGGLDEAVAEVFGEQVAWFVEYADAPAHLLAHHWPDVPNHRDATTVDWSTVSPINLFCAGYSCQPFSLAGRRLGADDERHVWPFLARGEQDPTTGEVVRPGALAVLRPRFAVFENVAGHLSLGFDQVLVDLHELGYDTWWTLWNASDEGAPHRRRRLFILAVRRDEPVMLPSGAALVARHDAEQLWLGPDDGLFGAVSFTDRIPATGAQIRGGMYALPAPATASPQGLLPTPRTSDSHGPGLHGNGGMDLRTAVTLLPTPTARDDKGAGYGDAPGRPLSEAVHALLPTPTATPYGNNQSPRATDGTKGGPNQRGSSGDLMLPSAAIKAQDGWGGYGPAIRRWEKALGRPAPAPTMTGVRGGQQLSPAFVEWMMALPAGHVTAVPGLSRSEQLKLLGNGVVPVQGAAALRWLLDVSAASRAVAA